ALPGWEGAASAALSAGARGFGELRPRNQRWDPLGPESHRLCDLAASAGVPLLWHVSEPVGHQYPGKSGGITPADLIALALDHPATPMVAAHLGGGASFYLQMPEIRASLTNLYFDTAAAFLLYDETSITRLVDLAGPDRVLFASDYPLLSPRRQLERVQALLPGGLIQAVCGGNAQSLFFGQTETND
ncbi:MAG: amidohydrolase family protein, partial [Tepidiformaceae bacterium]